MGQENALIHLDEPLVDLRLGGVNVKTSAGELARVEGVNEGLFVNNTTASSVDKDSTVLHLVELGLAEALLGLFVQRKIERDDVSLSKELGLRLDVSPGRVCVGVRVSVVVDDLHVKSCSALGERRADTAHADDTEGLVLGVVGGLETRLPLAGTSVDLGAVVLTQAGKNEEHGSVGSGVVDSGRSMGNGDTAGLGSVNIDLVVTGTVVADGLEGSGEVVDELSVEKTDLVDRVIVTVDGNNVGVLAAG